MGTPLYPKRLSEINYTTGKILEREIIFDTTDTKKIAWRALKMHIDSTGIYITEGVTPSILYSDLNVLKPTRLSIDSTHFIKCTPISPSSFILKAFSPDYQKNILIKQTRNPIRSIPMPDILEKQVEGIFCTDGDLHYESKAKRLVYVYRYRNEFIYMDMEGQPVYKGKTIDTISKAKISVAKIGSDHKKQYILAAPPLVVNHRSRVFENKLFIHSNIRAKNENRNDFREKSVIDIYSLEDARYLFSFYIPPYQGKTMRDFIVHDRTLIVLYETHLLVFTLKSLKS